MVCAGLDQPGRFPVGDVAVLPPNHGRGALDPRTWVARSRRRKAFSALLAGADILHSHFGTAGASNFALARQAGVPHAVSFYGYDATLLPRDGRWRARFARMFPNVDAVLCEGPFMARTVEGLGCDPSRIRVHRLGVDLDRLPFRERSRPPDAPMRILMAAGFREKKGFPIAFEALGRLKGRVPFQVTLIGDSSGEPRAEAEKEAIVAAIERNGLGPVTERRGFLRHDALVAEAYRHDLFLSPSITASDGDAEGGAPVALLEMAATGLPIVSTRHCDIPNIIQHGKTGLLAPERDAAALAEHIEWMAVNPEGAAGMARAGRSFIEANHDARIQASRLAATYAGLAGAS